LVLIAISGPHGSGKSTAAKHIATMFNFKYLSAGELFRSIAKERGLSLKELSIIAEKDEEIDRLIDNKTLEVADKSEDLVVDAQLAGWLLKNKADLLIYITAPFDIRVKRISQRDKKPLEITKEETETRERSEKLRYQKLYKIDITDLSIYDIIINTKKFDPDDCVQIIVTAIKKIIKR